MASGVPLVAQYAQALRAVELAITTPSRNGPAERNNTRLKRLKREVVERFELLKARVLPFEPLAR